MERVYMGRGNISVETIILKVVKAERGCRGCYYKNDTTICKKYCNINAEGKIYKQDKEGEK